MTTDYYQQFHSLAGQVVFPIYQKVQREDRNIDDLQKKLEKEKKSLSDLQARRARLHEKTPENIEGFKKSLKKIAEETEPTQAAIDLLEGLLADAQTQRKNRRLELKNALQRMMIQKRPQGDAIIHSLLRQARAEYDAYVEAFQKLYQEYGCTVDYVSESHYPGTYSAAEWQDLEARMQHDENAWKALYRSEEPKPAKPEAPAAAGPEEPKQDETSSTVLTGKVQTRPAE